MTMMVDDHTRLMWAYRAVFKQTGAGGNIKVGITAVERTEVLYGMLGPNDYAADRSLQVVLTDSAENTIAHLLFTTPADNEAMPFPTDTAAAVVAGQGNQFEKRVLMGSGEKLIILAFSAATNEELTVAIRALINSKQPAVATTGSGGTVTTTVTYDKVI